MTTQEQKCADRIGEMMRAREQEIKSISENPNSDDNDDFALSVETDKMTTVCLSYGGPADYLEILWHGSDYAWEIKRVTYRYSDWFDTATMDVEEGSALWQYAQFIIEGEA